MPILHGFIAVLYLSLERKTYYLPLMNACIAFPNSIKKETEKGMCLTVHLNVFCCCLLQKLWFIVNVWNVELYSVILMMESNKACHYMPHGHSLYHKANTKTWNYAPAEILWLSPSTLAWVSRAKHLPAWSRPQNIFSLWLLSRNLFVFFFFVVRVYD